MKTETFNTPTTRAAFERKLNILKEVIEGGRIQFAMGVRTDGLTRVRCLPNGRIDLLSIDESTRLTANMVEGFPGGTASDHEDEDEDNP